MYFLGTTCTSHKTSFSRDTPKFLPDSLGMGFLNLGEFQEKFQIFTPTKGVFVAGLLLDTINQNQDNIWLIISKFKLASKLLRFLEPVLYQG